VFAESTEGNEDDYMQLQVMANRTAVIESVSVLRRWKSLEELMVLFMDDPRLIQCEQISLLGTWNLYGSRVCVASC